MSHVATRLEGVRLARPQRATHRVIALCVAAIVAACSNARGEFTLPPFAWSRDTLIATPHLLQDFADTIRRRDVIHRAFQIRATSGHLLVSDVGADRIAVLDSVANVIRWIGRRGRGPGELAGAGHLAVRGDRLFVAEAMNGRVSEFTHDGTFVTTYRAPFSAGALAATADAILVAVQSSSNFGAALGRGFEPTPALRRVRGVRDATDRWASLPGHDLIAADSAGVWVFDQGTGDVCFYVDRRARPFCRALPASLHARLHEYRAERVARFEAGTGQYVRAAPLAKDMVRAGPWLALLLPLPEMPIVLVDVNDGSLTPAIIVHDTLPGWARSAASFAFDGRRFVVVGDDGIGRLNLTAKRIRQ